MAEAGLSRRALLAGGAGLAAGSGAQVQARALPGAGGRRADVALFAGAYEALHPGLWRYQSPARWRGVVDRLEREAVAARDHGQYWLAFARATAAVRCGHSYVNPFNMGKAWEAVMVARADRLPFHFRWPAGALVVTKPLVEHPALVRGTRVTAIDGEADATLLKRMLPLARADGGNDLKRIANMEVREGATGWENFDLLWKLGETPPPPSVRVRLQPPGRRAVEAELPLIQRDSRAGRGRGETLGWERRHAEDATILTMPSWATYSSKWNWRGWMAAALDEATARGSKRLVLDLRGNEGGEDCGNPILARMIDRPIKEAGAARRVRFRETPESLRPHLDSWDPSFHRLGVDAAEPDAEGLYQLPERAEGPEQVLPADGARLAAKLIVLMDSANSSATFRFAQRVQGNGLGVLLGEPSGGNRRGINGGAFFFLHLPESGLEVDLPLIGYFPSGSPPDAGLFPDVLVPTTGATIAAGTDPQLERALGLA